MGPFYIKTGNDLAKEYKHKYFDLNQISFDDFDECEPNCSECEEHHETGCKNDCLCKLLNKYRGEEVTIITKTGGIITGQLEDVKDCCVKIISCGSMSPFIPQSITFIRCIDIESFSIDF